jgi:hypothetical protein
MYVSRYDLADEKKVDTGEEMRGRKKQRTENTKEWEEQKCKRRKKN